MGKIRLLIADDSLTVRKHLVEVASGDPEIEVVGEARDGHEAVELCKRLRPDVVTLDIVMPGMTGLEATEQIMAYCPTPILVVSASFNRGELFKTYDALAAGAVDVLDKPRGDDSDERWERVYRSTVKLVSRIKVITHPRARLGQRGPVPAVPATPSVAPAAGRYDLVAIGASTGGPAALLQVLRGLPANFPLPILFVLHIGEPFGQALADWLASQLQRPVAAARHGEPLPKPGDARVLMAPPDHHLEVRGDRLVLTRDAERHSCRPSVDVLFESVARELGPRAVGCLLTGMGRDGAAGLLAMRQAGGLTLAQDEATSVVYGMPREAVLLGAASRVLPLDGFAPALAALPAPGRSS
jgi:two-component system chemotaxis response regulator CheB